MDMGVVLPCPSKAFLIKAKERVNTVCVCVCVRTFLLCDYKGQGESVNIVCVVCVVCWGGASKQKRTIAGTLCPACRDFHHIFVK